MRKLKILSSGAVLGALMCIFTAGVIAASTITGALYRADISVANVSYTATKVSVPFTFNTQSLLDGQYINSSFSNSTMRDSAGQDIAFMPGQGIDPWIMWVEQISQNSALNYSLYTGGNTAMGGKLAYFPGTSGMTVADAASLELGNNFEIELSGYMDTINGVGESPILKAGSLSITIDAAQQITVGNYSNENLTIANSSWEGTNCYATSWYGQTFTFTNNVILNGFNLYCKKVGAPAGNLDYYLYATSGGLPTGSALASGSILASTVSTSAGLLSLAFTTPVSLTAATTYAVVFSCPSGNSSNRISYWYTNNSSYAGGQQLSSSNSGASWTGSSIVDIYITLSGAYLNALVSASNVAYGEHVVKTNLSGGTLNLYIDGVLEDSAAFVGSITDNTNDWIIGAGGSMPYLYYAKITVGGVLKGSWTWEYAATFTDLSGNGNDATPSFRTTTTDADVSASIKSYSAISQSLSSISDDDAPNVIPDMPEVPSGWFTDLHPETLPGGTEINNMLIDADIPPGVFWYPMWFLGGTVVVMLVFGVSRKILPAAMGGISWDIFWCAAVGVDFWVLIPNSLVAIGEIANRKKQSL
ncbi:hypothetical protein DEHALATV1_0077 [Dehalococcoides mccartyi]|uniref:Uncharacterized protein n=1 Tax=Dehalococcoides mccartyi TaxID=61435 RepID=A0AB33HVW7_9CHLR|nr:hypothetical protein [Dehalococcoides mccartyi]BAZ96705.1 hypothetical protein DEHALATV1_0077 [Dehalococcoides mccartyi]